MYKEYLLDTGNTDSVLDYFQRDDVYWEKEKNPKTGKHIFVHDIWKRISDMKQALVTALNRLLTLTSFNAQISQG